MKNTVCVLIVASFGRALEANHWLIVGFFRSDVERDVSDLGTVLCLDIGTIAIGRSPCRADACQAAKMCIHPECSIAGLLAIPI